MKQTLKTLPLARLALNPDNPRAHNERNLAIIEHSLDEFGQVEPLLAQARPDRGDPPRDARGQVMYRLIAGHGRVAAMTKLGIKKAEVRLLDCTDEQADRLEIILNRSAELAEWNVDKLLAKLDDWDPGELNSLLGFTPDELADLERSLDLDNTSEPGASATGVPTPGANASGSRKPRKTRAGCDQSGELKTVFQILITCADESQQADLLASLAAEGLQCRALIS